ncbi:MAG TPA: M23 family metallopeptidase [Dehalococcoidia bacterium]|nr:M23 family metallopeptidase [Dehalococcoidia bacterium]
MLPPVTRRAFAPLILLLAFALGACSSGGDKELGPAVTIEALSPTATVPGSTSTPQPPPAATPTLPPAGGITFKPTAIPQGGFAIVYLNEAASSATMRFEGRMYPMLNDNNRWWAVIGVGALIEPGLHPVSITYTPLGKTAQQSITQSIAITDVAFPTEEVELDDATASLLAPDIVNAEIAQRASIYGGFTAQKLWSGPWVPPAKGSYSDPYGVGRSYNRGPVTDYHRGTDFLGDIGSPVYAAAGGRVVFTGELKVRGNSIIIDHGAGIFTGYHHLSAIGVEVGDVVKAGAQIGDIGSTGLATGPHLHWDVLIRGVEVNGALFLDGKEFGP